MNNSIEQGFILTRSSRDHGRGTTLTFWLSTANGPVQLLVEDEKSVFFVERQDEPQVAAALAQLNGSPEIRPLALKTFAQTPVSGLYFATQRASFNAQEVLEGAGITAYEADIKLSDRYLMERFVYGSLAFSGSVSQHARFGECRAVKVKPSDYRPALKVLSLDIECSMAGELYSIGLYGRHDGAALNHVVMIGAPQQGEAWISWVADERGLLLKTAELIQQIDPDVIIGWNVIDFDFRVMLRRAKELGIEFALGRDGSAALWREHRNNQNNGSAIIAGRVVVDGIDALKTATHDFPSFSLESVAQTLLGRGKKTEDVDNRIEEIVHNFLHHKDKLAAYNLEDCVLVWDIFEQTKVLEFLVYRSQITGLELDRQGGSVAAFTNLYLPRLHRAGYVAPNLPTQMDVGSPGGYVMDSRPGLYKNIAVLDFKSLYPSIIRTFKIDPVGMVEGLLRPELAIEGYQGARFSREIHFLPEIITSLWRGRDDAKANQDPVRSQALKIIMNSFYGVLGASTCRFADARLSSSITLRGHHVLRTTAEWVAQMGYQVIYGDTDSIFIALPAAATHAECGGIARAMQDQINDRWRADTRAEYALECHMEIQFDTHYSRFWMPTIRGSEQGSKKRYAGLVQAHDAGRVTEKLVFKGLESVRADWTDLAKIFQRDLFDCVFHDQDPSAIVDAVIADTRAGRRDADLVYRKRLRRPLHLYTKNVPPHVRAARGADEFNQLAAKPQRYQNRGRIDYVMTTKGPEALEYRQHPIDYEHYIDKQLRPVADAILPLLGISFNARASAQLELF